LVELNNEKQHTIMAIIYMGLVFNSNFSEFLPSPPNLFRKEKLKPKKKLAKCLIGI